MAGSAGVAVDAAVAGAPAFGESVSGLALASGFRGAGPTHSRLLERTFREVAREVTIQLSVNLRWPLDSYRAKFESIHVEGLVQKSEDGKP